MREKWMVKFSTMVFCAALLVSLLVPGAARAQAVKLKMATYVAPTSSHALILEEFARELDRRTGGQVKVDLFAGGSLISPVATFDGVTRGMADIAFSHAYYTPGRMPVIEAIGLPLGYPSAWVGGQVINDFYSQFKPKEFDGVRVLWMMTSSPSAIATAKKPIRKLEDLRGLTIRAPGIAGDVIRALGGTPAPTPMPEVYDAIRKGIIDGETSNFETLRGFRLAEVVRYSTSVWQISFPFPFFMIMNKDSYAKLPAEVKPIFDGLVGEYKEAYIAMWNSIDFPGKEFGLEKGVEFIDLSPEEVVRWRAAVEPVIDGYVKNMTGRGFAESEVRGWIKFIRERIDFWTKRQISLRIPSAAGPPALRLRP